MSCGEPRRWLALSQSPCAWRRECSTNRLAHGGNFGAVIRRVEDRRAGHEGVGAGRGDRADVLRGNAAVDLQPDRAAAGIDARARLTQLVQRTGDELLPTEARVH